MTRKRWIILVTVLVLLLLCGIGSGAGAALIVREVPGVARLVYGDPPTATPIPATPTPRPTFTPAPTVTPTANPTPTRPNATEPAPSPTVSPTATPSPTPRPRPQWIVFETKRGKLGDYEIFAMRTDGSRLVNLTNSWADDVAPVWSPDGRRIAFVSLRDTPAGKYGLGPGAIYVMDFDPWTGTGGNNLIRVTDATTDDGWATWSPDGRRIAFESARSGNWDIWVVNVDGTGLINLTNSPGDDRYPAWSPNGKKIAFTTNRSGDYDVWAMNADGSSPVNLTNTPGRDRYAMWSPDGRQIAFNTRRDGNQEIYLMNVADTLQGTDGSNQRNVTHSPSTEGLADWSPDGRRLVLYSDRSGNKDIYIVDLTTGKWTNITNDPASDEFCTWSR